MQQISHGKAIPPGVQDVDGLLGGEFWAGFGGGGGGFFVLGGLGVVGLGVVVVGGFVGGFLGGGGGLMSTGAGPQQEQQMWLPQQGTGSGGHGFEGGSLQLQIPFPGG